MLHKDLAGVDLHVNALHADTHVAAGTDPLILAESQVTDLTADLAVLASRGGGVDVRDYGWDAATDKAVAIQAAVTAAEAAGGGIVLLPPVIGAVWDSTVTVNSITVSIIGPGSAACTFACGGAADHLLIHPSVFSTEGAVQANHFVGFTMAGTASASAVGIHFVNIIGVAFEDVVIKEFTGATAVGLWMEAKDAGAGMKWLERTTMYRVSLSRNKVNWKVSGDSSFAYTRVLDLRMELNAGQTGIVFSGGGTFYNSSITALVNATNTAIILDIQDTFQVISTVFNITGEYMNSGGTLLGTGIQVAVGAILRGEGTINLYGVKDTNASRCIVQTVRSGTTGRSITMDGMLRLRMRHDILVWHAGAYDDVTFANILDIKHGVAGYIVINAAPMGQVSQYTTDFYTCSSRYETASATWYSGSFHSIFTENTFTGGAALSGVVITPTWINGTLQLHCVWGSAESGNVAQDTPWWIDVAIYGTEIPEIYDLEAIDHDGYPLA